MGGSAMSEGLYGLGCGFLFGMRSFQKQKSLGYLRGLGITSAIVGQPLDSIKTKMQAQVVSVSQYTFVRLI